MLSINIISVILILFKYAFNCGSGKISNFVKWLGLSRSLATPDIGYIVLDKINILLY